MRFLTPSGSIFPNGTNVLAGQLKGHWTMRKAITVAGLALALAALVPAGAMAKAGGTERPLKVRSSGIPVSAITPSGQLAGHQEEPVNPPRQRHLCWREHDHSHRAEHNLLQRHSGIHGGKRGQVVRQRGRDGNVHPPVPNLATGLHLQPPRRRDDQRRHRAVQGGQRHSDRRHRGSAALRHRDDDHFRV